MAYAGPLWRSTRGVGGTTATAGLGWAASTHQAGDTLFVILASPNGNPTLNAQTANNWTLVASYGQGTVGATDAVKLSLYKKNTPAVAPANEPTLTVASSNDHTLIMPFAAQGEVEIDVFDGNTASASSSVAWPSITTTGNNRLIVNILTDAADSAAARFSSAANSNLTNVTERADTGYTGGNGSGVVIVTGELEIGGASGSTTGTLTSSPQARMTLALKFPGGDPEPPARRPIRSFHWL